MKRNFNLELKFLTRKNCSFDENEDSNNGGSVDLNFAYAKYTPKTGLIKVTSSVVVQCQQQNQL